MIIIRTKLINRCIEFLHEIRINNDVRKVNYVIDCLEEENEHNIKRKGRKLHKLNKFIKKFAKENKGKLKGKNLLVEGAKDWNNQR